MRANKIEKYFLQNFLSENHLNYSSNVYGICNKLQQILVIPLQKKEKRMHSSKMLYTIHKVQTEFRIHTHTENVWYHQMIIIAGENAFLQRKIENESQGTHLESMKIFLQFNRM